MLTTADFALAFRFVLTVVLCALALWWAWADLQGRRR